jgi:TM2 domain-containing membrane protein YozV
MNDQHLNNYPKSIATAYVLLFFLGVFGAHRFYIRSTGLAIAYLFTFGFFGIGVVVDVFILAQRAHQANEAITDSEMGRRVRR